jgi:hypothetical protein
MNSWGTGHDTVKVMGILLDRLESLTATRGAAQIVGFPEPFCVEALSEFFANLRGCMNRPIGEIPKDFGTVEKGLRRRAIMAVVGRDRSESQTRCVVKLWVTYT